MSSLDLTTLHRLVWFNAHEGLDALLTSLAQEETEHLAVPSTRSASETAPQKERTASPDTRAINGKFRGLSPVHMAVQLGHRECLDVLLKHQADTLTLTELGFFALQEATSIGDRDMMRELLLRRLEQVRNLVHARQPMLHEIVQKELADFYLEMNWEFKSWVPFFSMICPNDCYKIWKRDSRIRIDTSLIGFDKLRWQRGNVSFLFEIGAEATSFYLIDHDRRIWEHVKNFRDLTQQEIEEDLNVRLNQEIASGRINTSLPIQFSRTRSILGLGDEIVESVGRYTANMYSIENLEWMTRTRKEHLRDRPEGDLSDKTAGWFLGYGGKTAASYLSQTRRKEKTEQPDIAEVNAEKGEEQEQKQDDQLPVDGDPPEVGENDSSSDTGKIESIFQQSLKEIHDALTDTEDMSASETSEINHQIEDLDPSQIESLLEDNKKLSHIHTPSLPYPADKPEVAFEDYFPAAGCDKEAQAALPYVHLGRPLALKTHSKRLSASLWMSDEFPLTIGQLMPLFEMMSPSNEHFARLREFISIKLPPGFPVQLEVPILMFLSARITFKNFEWWTREGRKEIPIPASVDPTASSATWFEIPADYTEGVIPKAIFKYHNDGSK